MCLYPRLIKNPRYKENKKNKGIVPFCEDTRKYMVAIGCGECIECRKQKARQWQIRLNEELKENNKAYFVTLTFNNEELEKLCKELNINECNGVATKAVRRFLELWRKHEKKSPKHWLITELGHTNTERIHLHGIIWATDRSKIEKYWKYGNIWIGDYCNAKTINYIIKYVNKLDTDHKNYKSIILCSKGLGKRYFINEGNKEIHKFNNELTKEFYRLQDGSKVNLPIYYRNKLWTEEQRDKLWTNLLNKKIRYVRGIKIDISTQKGINQYFKTLEQQQKINKQIGYGDLSKEWQKEKYNVTLKMINKEVEG